MKADGGLIMKHDNDYTIGLKNIWEVVCYGSDGQEKWREKNKNLVTTEGANHVLGGTFKSVTQITGWYVGLKGSGTPVIADTMGSHSTWGELTPYSQSTRQTLTLGSITGTTTSTCDNSSSKATFSINGTATIVGAFLSSSDSKGSSGGSLYGVVDFASSRAVISGDTLEVTVTLTAATA
jgi:hypothetical protein